MANGTPIANPGWQDIQGMFANFAQYMMWRLDLGSYEDVAANAQTILLRISNPGVGLMPPPGFPPLTPGQVQTFQNWVDQGCPENPTTSGASSGSQGAVAATAPASTFRFD